MTNPYRLMPNSSFWRSAVAQIHYSELSDLWKSFSLLKIHKVATAGSCFAQHIGNNLAARGADFMDMEPAPSVFPTVAEARRWGYGVFSCRYGNIYTSRQLIQLFDEAHGSRIPEERVWQKENRFFDAMRPGIDPVGQANPEDVLRLRELHLKAVREMFATLDVFVFTMGLTEGWESKADGTMFPMAPGTIAGKFVAEKYNFHNLRHNEILSDMTSFWERLLSVNPQARMLLTVSPVPLIATATDNHVLVATTYSKSVLRSVAGELAEDHEAISYFPSYEIIASAPSRGMYFNPDLRTVNQYGVDYVMKHFFSGALAEEFGEVLIQEEESEIICDEEKLEDSID